MNCNELQESTQAARYLVKRPKALQWFYKGQLHKVSEEERQASRFELFLDLLYVAIGMIHATHLKSRSELQASKLTWL